MTRSLTNFGSTATYYLPAHENPDYFRVRVALLGDNETKYPRPYQPEVFGPGRKDGWRPAWRE